MSFSLSDQDEVFRRSLKAHPSTFLHALRSRGRSQTNADCTSTFRTLLDTSKPVEKLSVFAANYTPTFTGIRYRIRTSGLTEDAFTPIAAGETIELAINAAEVHDLTSGGTFDVLSQGVIAYAEAGSTEISGRAFYQSNTVSLDVDGAVAARSARPINLDLLKRTDLQSDCTGTNGQEIRSALSSCSSLATAAANAVGTSAA